MRLKYNAPAVLSFTLLSSLVTLLATILGPGLLEVAFSVPGRNWTPGCLSHTEDKDLDTLARGLSGRFKPLLFVILPICNEQNNLVGF